MWQLSNNQPNPGLSNVWIFWNSKAIPGKSASDCPNDVFTFVFTKNGKWIRCKILRIINDHGSARVQVFFWNLKMKGMCKIDQGHKNVLHYFHNAPIDFLFSTIYFA